jgi:hypothetical protein
MDMSQIESAQWEMWADMIRSDQMTVREILEFFDRNPEFHEWYRESLL